jgi:hypothetical protein
MESRRGRQVQGHARALLGVHGSGGAMTQEGPYLATTDDAARLASERRPWWCCGCDGLERGTVAAVDFYGDGGCCSVRRS